jgi:arylsulfatase
VAALLVSAACTPAAEPPTGPPNIVVIFTDDHGYGDIGAFGALDIPTPNLDRMAAEGVKLTSFYVSTAVCSASRSALLTGSYNTRLGIYGAWDHTAKVGLNPDEVTIAELVKPLGYRTAAVGKWHLGHLPPFLPTAQGFDSWFGLPYSNDMWPRHPQNPDYYPDLPLMDGDSVVQLDPDQAQLTRWYTDRAVRFIDDAVGEPFFLYLAHSMPHVPLFHDPRFADSTARGIYGDVIAEIDWSVGEVLAALERNGIDDNTLVIFASDNGPWSVYGDHAGSTGGLRGTKATAFEGGVRVPFIARWPGRIPAGTSSDVPAMTIDVLPTVAGLVGAPLPADRTIDGRDIWPLLSGASAGAPHEALFFYWGKGLHAVRSGKWKLHFPHDYYAVDSAGQGGTPGRLVTRQLPLSLYDLEADRAESRDMAAEHPDVVARLSRLADSARAELGDGLTGIEGSAVRPLGRLEP